MRKFIKSRSAWEIVMVSALSLFAVVGIVMAATTIGTDITTGGNIYATSTLYVDGASTFTNTVTMSAANLKVSPGYGLDVATSGILNIGTTTASSINIGSLTAITAAGGRITVPAAYGLDVATSGILNLGTTTASSINIGSLTAITAAGGRITVPAAYGLDVASSGILNIGTTTASRVNIGSASAPVVMANASSTLANFGSGTTVSGLLWGTCQAAFGNVTASSTAVATCTGSSAVNSTDYKVIVTPISTSTPYMVLSSASSTASSIQVAAYNTGWGGTVANYTLYLSWIAIK